MEVCWPTAQLEAAQALYADQHEDAPFHDGSFLRWSKKRSRDYPFRYTDGVTFWLSPVEVDPDADWLGPSAAEGSPDADEAQDSD